jgi:deoxyribodipyrimidine photo-lyase
MNLNTTFSNREEMTAYLAEQLEGLYSTAPIPNDTVGGRHVALEALRKYTFAGYGRRNFVDANISRLSPYLRHGMLSILEVADHARQTVRGRERDEFLKQLSWREFFGLVLEQEGEAVFENLEPPKYPVRWTAELPDDIREARTGLPCVDAWVSDLIGDGYMTNHERLWFAAYVTHFRKVDWKAGFRFFREHLLDGDIASNGLSWQWVASTFSNKPYFMNQENIAKYSNDRWCRTCRADCPFRKSYEQLEVDLFGQRFDQ